MLNTKIPVFYACDDCFIKYAIVSITSLIENANPDYEYDIHILISGVSDEMRKETLKLQKDGFSITFDDVSDYLKALTKKLPIRDYYSKTTYFRLFIADMFPQFDKAIYIDADTIVQGDISKLYNQDLGENIVGACHEQAMVQNDTYGTYVEKCLGISRFNYFNAGLLFINCHLFRKMNMLSLFTELLQFYDFVVTQDEDYLNVMCRDRVLWLDQRWNTEIFGNITYPIEEANVLHYIMTNKPWHYKDCRYAKIFWNYAKKTSVYTMIKEVLEAYTDEQKERDAISCINLQKLAEKETAREDNYLNRLTVKCGCTL